MLGAFPFTQVAGAKAAIQKLIVQASGRFLLFFFSFRSPPFLHAPLSLSAFLSLCLPACLSLSFSLALSLPPSFFSLFLLSLSVSLSLSFPPLSLSS